jgi:hypothetical protein
MPPAQFGALDRTYRKIAEIKRNIALRQQAKDKAQAQESRR